MRIIIGLMVVVCTALGHPACGEDDPKKESKLEVFSVDGIFSVDTPPNGFTWTLQKIEATGVRCRTYACTKKGAAARMILVISENAAKDDQARVATLSSQYYTLAQSLKDAGLSNLKSTKPEIEPPIKDRVVFRVFGTAEDVQAHVYAITVFGQNTYLFTVFATSKEEADRFAKITESLREPKQDTSNGEEPRETDRFSPNETGEQSGEHVSPCLT